MKATVVKVSKSDNHKMGKTNCGEIELIAALGVKGDAHAGVKVKHRYLVRKNPEAPNLRQVHIIHQELIDELKSKGFDITAGQMGENITTKGLDILSLPCKTLLHIGQEAVIMVEGLRNPCVQLDGIQKGLMRAVIDKDQEGKPIFKAGIMCTVRKGGIIRDNDLIKVTLPEAPHQKLHTV